MQSGSVLLALTSSSLSSHLDRGSGQSSSTGRAGFAVLLVLVLRPLVTVRLLSPNVSIRDCSLIQGYRISMEAHFRAVSVEGALSLRDRHTHSHY